MNFLLILLFYVSILGWTFGDSIASKNNDGNKLYKEGKIDEALSKWRDAQIENPDSDKLHYNIGNGLHEQKKYEDAFKEYEKSLGSKDNELQRKAYYNMGNTYYRMGKLPEAIENYKKCLDINPDDEDAKYNIEFVRKKIKENLKKEDSKKESKQQQQESQEKDSKDSGQKEQQSESSQAQEDQQKEEDARQAAQKSEEDKEKEAKENQEKQSGEEKEESEGQKDEEKPSGEEKKGDMSKEDAVRLLDAMKDDEKDLQRELKNQPGEGRYRVDKDW
jgi:tetratricopeptide (TPR) repeat protein